MNFEFRSAKDTIRAADAGTASAVPFERGLAENLALELLKSNDISPGQLEQLSKSSSVMKSRKVQLAVAQHPKTPRHVSLPLLRDLFTFELMQVTLNPVGLADIKKAAEDRCSTGWRQSRWARGFRWRCGRPAMWRASFCSIPSCACCRRHWKIRG